VTKLPSSTRTVFVAAFLAVFAAGCGKDPAQPWHYWIAFALIASALLIVLVIMPAAYYFKVWRLKQRGR
jgi:membrane protein YdbS with pleckstrin-like domain